MNGTINIADKELQRTDKMIAINRLMASHQTKANNDNISAHSTEGTKEQMTRFSEVACKSGSVSLRTSLDVHEDEQKCLVQYLALSKCSAKHQSPT